MSAAVSPTEVVSTVPDSPTLAHLAIAMAQFALLGAAAGIGSGDLATAVRTVPSGLAVGTGALVMTAPALVVMHQFLGLAADPDALVHTLSRGLVRGGRLAFGFAPMALFFATTTNLWAVFLTLVLAATGGTILMRLMVDLRRVEIQHPAPNPATRGFTMTALTAGWAGLAVLIALRLAWDVAAFVAG
ncbi:MAG: hypothetical protein KC912_08990 [Proteobacteria bacterium]|nr:hypothetical protein [Pseudomonadota bacterium]